MFFLDLGGITKAKLGQNEKNPLLLLCQSDLSMESFSDLCLKPVLIFKPFVKGASWGQGTLSPPLQRNRSFHSYQKNDKPPSMLRLHVVSQRHYRNGHTEPQRELVFGRKEKKMVKLGGVKFFCHVMASRGNGTVLIIPLDRSLLLAHP